MNQLAFDDRNAEAATKLLEPRGGLWSMRVFELAYQVQVEGPFRDGRAGSKPSFNLCK